MVAFLEVKALKEQGYHINFIRKHIEGMNEFEIRRNDLQMQYEAMMDGNDEGKISDTQLQQWLDSSDFDDLEYLNELFEG